MISLVILGNGNVATHLFNAFSKATNVDVTKINSRALNDIPNSDITIIAVSDDAIQQISKTINNRSGLIVHTSGAVDIKVLQNKRKGVFYPLQSFTKNVKVDFKTIPFCLETTDSEDFILLEKLTKSISNKVYKIDSEQRKKLHVAAVFVNNFTNYMYKIGSDICKENEIPFEVLFPLIKETANKVKTVNPKDAQTGPAKRNDLKTMNNHLKSLNSRQQKKIYKLITKLIMKEDNGKEL